MSVLEFDDAFDQHDFGDGKEDFDAMYENSADHDLGNIQNEHGSVITHLLSQISIGMDLTKITLPTFILERRSLLEMYADFFTHPAAFVSLTTVKNAEDRFIAVVRYYLSAFYPARKSGVAKKPYNPILGETFRCWYDIPGMPHSSKIVDRGPVPGSSDSQLTFIAEQVSHHPPVSAFYAEHPKKRISFHADIWTKSSFLGLSIGVSNIGCGTVILHEFNEEYTVTFPDGFGRSILTKPWVELGGTIKITCEQTGYYAYITFMTKPFIGGKPHKITGNIYKLGRSILSIRGEWNNIMFARTPLGVEYEFANVKAQEDVKKQCLPVMLQHPRESRRLWRHVTFGLIRNDMKVASSAKQMIEERQRNESVARSLSHQDWVPKYFTRMGNRWIFRDTLEGRVPLLTNDDD